MKTCIRCKESKELDDFCVRSNQKDGRDYYCKICKKAIDSKWLIGNKSKKKDSDRAYRDLNKERLRSYFTEYRRNSRKNPAIKLKDNLRKRIYKALKGQSKSDTTVGIIGCSVENLMKYLENMFQVGMTWENYGKWHVDHKIPLTSAKDNLNRIVELCHYSNLQPLWASDNLSKSSRIEE